jgi:hypothetical protein
MQWIDSVDVNNILDTIDNENIEDYTGLPFIRQQSYNEYEWNADGVSFKSSTELKELVMTFNLKYKGRIITGDYGEYGTTKGYHLFRAIHNLLDIHLYTHLHPLFIPKQPFTIRSINIFSPNREILQLFLKGLRACATISNQYNYAYKDEDDDDENILFHSSASL